MGHILDQRLTVIADYARTHSAAAVVAECLARIDAKNPSLNAISAVRRQAAHTAAEVADAQPAAIRAAQPLFGVPIAVKEEIDVAGMVTTFGGAGNSQPAVADAEVVRRLTEAGAIIVGKTYMSEFGQAPFTEGAWGATVNPFDPGLSPGGSSGGSAVAVATGMVPVALGGDGGGSIRIPAACAHLVGLKPTRGLVSSAPYREFWGSLGTQGPLARTAEDAALVYDVIAGSLPTDRWQYPTPTEPFVDTVAKPLPPHRFGWTVRSFVPGVRPVRQVALACARAAVELARCGHQVRALGPRWYPAPHAYTIQFHHAVAAEVAAMAHPERLERRSRQTAALARYSGARGLAAALRSGQQVAKRFDQLFTDVDFLLTPVLPDLAPPRRRLSVRSALVSQLASIRTVSYVSVCNLTGHPAVSVPFGVTDTGLPLAVQVIGPHGSDGALLHIAAHLMRRS